MEGLMNRIVAKPNLITDDALNAKIEKLFSVEIFQKMVENADIFQDLSSSSLFTGSQILQKSMLSQNTQGAFKPEEHSAALEIEGDDDSPQFGQSERTENFKDLPNVKDVLKEKLMIDKPK